MPETALVREFLCSSASSAGPPQSAPDSGPLSGGGPGGAGSREGGDGAGGETLAESRPPQPGGAAVEGGTAPSAGGIGDAGAIAAV